MIVKTRQAVEMTQPTIEMMLNAKATTPVYNVHTREHAENARHDKRLCHRRETRATLCVIISPVAMTHSMGEIIKPVCLCPCVRLRALSSLHFLMDFHHNWHRHKTPKVKNEFVGEK